MIICEDSANILLQGIIKIYSSFKLTPDLQDSKPLRRVALFHLSNLTFPNITKARCIPSTVIPACLFLNVTS